MSRVNIQAWNWLITGLMILPQRRCIAPANRIQWCMSTL
jgi:hypothetical protein